MCAPLPISEEELAQLLRASADTGETVRVTIPGGILIVADDNSWAIQTLAQMRGIQTNV